MKKLNPYAKGLRLGRGMRAAEPERVASLLERITGNLQRAEAAEQPSRVEYNRGILAGLKGR